MGDKHKLFDETSDTGMHEKFHEHPPAETASPAEASESGKAAAGASEAPEAAAAPAKPRHHLFDETSDTGMHETFHEHPPHEGASAADPPESAALVDSSMTGRPRLEAAASSGGGSSLAQKAAYAVLLLAGGGALALWAGPKVAPSLPAPAAAWFAPGSGSDSALREEFAAQIAAVRAQAAAAAEEARAAGATAAAQIEAAIAAIPQQASAPVDLSAVEAQIAALAAQVESRAGASSAVDPAALDALGERIDALAARIDAAAAAAETARADAAALASRFDSLGDAEAARDAAEREAESARRAAAMAAALTEIDRAMILGQPFPGALDALADAAGEAPPPALAEAAAKGAPTRESLKASFPDAAYAAITAMLEQEAAEGGGILAGVAARLEARVTGLPAEPIEGDDVKAVLSRARVSLLGGDIDATLAAIETLPEAARAAMAEWTDGAALRGAADTALSTWRNDLKLTL